MKSKSFVQNTAILFISMIITKLIGAVLKIPLTNILGGEGIGYFSTAYSLFSPVLAFASAGIPVVITKNVAENCALGRECDNELLKRVSVRTAAVIGLLGTVVMFIAALPFTLYISNSPNSLLSVLIISPSVFFCCIASVYRGYFEGMMNMMPTAASQITEAVIKASMGIFLSYYVYDNFYHCFGGESGVLPYASAAAILGVTISEICGTAVLALYSRVSRKKCVPNALCRQNSVSAISLIKKAIPISVTAVVANIAGFIDLVTVPNCINLSYANNIHIYSRLPAYTPILQQGTADLGNFVYGCYTGIVTALFALTSVLSVLAARSLQPRISAAYGTDNKSELVRNLKIMIKYTLWLGVPINLCFGVLSGDILAVLYPHRSAEVAICVFPLQILCSLGIFISFSGVIFGVFQSIGESDTPLKIMFFGVMIRFVFNVVLLNIPELNIGGAALSACLSSAVMTVVGWVILKKKLNIRLCAIKLAIKPFVSSLTTVLIIYFIKASTDFSGLFFLLFLIVTGGISILFIFAISEHKEIKPLIQRYLKKDLKNKV